MNRVIIILTIVFLASCSSKHEITLPDSDLVLHIRLDNESDISCTIKHNSELYQNIQRWFSANQTHWKSRPATYLPRKIIVGAQFKATILRKSIVMDDFLAHDIDPVFYKSLSCP